MKEYVNIELNEDGEFVDLYNEKFTDSIDEHMFHVSQISDFSVAYIINQGDHDE